MKQLIKESMSVNLITIDSQEKMHTAYRKMHANNIRHLPVINQEGTVVGILSDRDVNRAIHSEIHTEKKGTKVESTDFDPKAEVADYMSWPVKTFNKDKPIKEVAKEMLREKISSFLVSDGVEIIGIITTDDMLRVLIELLGEPSPRYSWNLESLIKSPIREVFA